eukprot:1028446-Pyramimonas_sp.AAC.1
MILASWGPLGTPLGAPLGGLLGRLGAVLGSSGTEEGRTRETYKNQRENPKRPLPTLRLGLAPPLDPSL